MVVAYYHLIEHCLTKILMGWLPILNKGFESYSNFKYINHVTKISDYLLLMEILEKEIIVITGATGYIGSWVAKYFLDHLDGSKYRVRASVRDLKNEKKLEPLKKAFGDKFENVQKKCPIPRISYIWVELT